MNVNTEESDLPQSESEAGETTAAPKKPARRPRTPKVTVEQTAAETSGMPAEDALDVPLGSSPEAQASAAKPRRRRVADAAAETVDVGVVDPASGSPVDAPVIVVGEPTTPSQPQPLLAAPASLELLEMSDASQIGERQAVQNADGPGEGALDGPRGRRRNRRDRKRGERGSTGERAEAGSGESGAGSSEVDTPVKADELFAKVVSGDFDLEDATDSEAEVSKRVLAPEPEAPKLHKVLAQSGIGSRRDMEELIVDGHVTVNGETAHIGQRISFGDQVKVNGKPVKLRIMPLPARIIAYHKPVGEIVTQDDPENRPTVFRRLPRLQQGKWQSVGRLDINTEGLLLFTNSGDLANQLMHPRFGVEREYAVRVLGLLTPEASASLLEGVMVDGQQAAFRSIEDGGGEGANHWYRVVITEGRNREVRKLFDAVGLTVSRLIRIRYGTVVLPHGLKRGAWVDLDDADVRAIRRLASGDRGPRDGSGGGHGNERGTQRPRQDRTGGRHNDRGRGGDSRPRDNEADAPYAPAQGRPSFDGDADSDIDFDPRSIPNPLEQTFDKRFVQNPRSPAGGRGFGRGGGGFGAGGSGPAPGPSGGKKGQGANQPDPLQTSLGFIGADAYHRKHRGGGGRGGNRGGGGGGSGSGSGGRRGR